MTDDAADVPAELGALPGAQRAAAGLRGPLPRAGAPPAAGRGPDRAGVRVGRRSARATRSATTAPSRCSGSGCRVQLTEVEANADGTFDVVAVGLEPDPARPARHLRAVPGRPRRRRSTSPAPASTRTCWSGRGRRSPPTARRSPRSAADPYEGALPRDAGVPLLDPGRLRARCRCPSARRCSRPTTPTTRLVLVTDLLRSELRAMNVIPSLPATEVARTRWSPN